MKRRDFIKTGCLACAAMAAGSSLASLQSCSPMPVYKATVDQHQIIVPKTAFLEGETMKVVRSSATLYDILLVAKPNEEPRALLMSCTHFSNALVPNTNGLNCNLHGSQFDLQGAVINGPASKALKKFTVSTNEQNYLINLKNN